MGPVSSFAPDLVFKNPEFSLPDTCQWEVARPSVEIDVKILTMVFGQVTSFLQVPIILSDNFIVGVHKYPQSFGAQELYCLAVGTRSR